MKRLPLWWLAGLALLLLTFAFTLFDFEKGTKGTPGINIVSAYCSNGEQIVTFKLQPASSEVAFASIVPVSDTSSPALTRSPSGELLPVNLKRTLRYVALPVRGAFNSEYSPGSYTIGYTPITNASRLAVGVAVERRGLNDLQKRIQKCWRTKEFVYLLHRTHKDPVYVLSDAITNALPTLP